MSKRSKARRKGKLGTGPNARAKETAVAALEARNYSTAETHFNKYLESHAGDAGAWHQLGVVYFQTGRSDQALNAMQKAADIDPTNIAFQNDLGGLYLAVGRPADAEPVFEHLVAIAPEFAEGLYNLSNAQFSLGNVGAAINTLERLLANHPEIAEAHFNLGVAYRDLDDHERALAAFKRAVVLDPELQLIHLELARCYKALRFDELAIAEYEQVRGGSRDQSVIVEHAEVLYRSGRTADAVALLHESRTALADSRRLSIALANIYQNLGEIDAVSAELRDAMQGSDVTAASAALMYANTRKFRDDTDPCIEQARQLVGRESAEAVETIPAHFALGKIYDDLGRYEDAIRHFRHGNDLQRGLVSYDKADLEQRIDSLIAFFDEAPDASNVDHDGCDLPVLVVGMPRSGTTLIEQILSSHSAVHGAGELSFFPTLATNAKRLIGSEQSYPNNLSELDRESADAVRNSYLQLLKRHSNTARRVVDKLPGNFFHLGMFKMLFADGYIIHARRDPRDTALSIYFQVFEHPHDYAWALDDIAHFYAQYERLMAHWRAKSWSRFIEVDYRALIQDVETGARELVDACDLNWEPGCLAFHNTRRDVKTASNWQVRQPIYQTSLARWRHYPSAAEHFLDALQDQRNRYGLHHDTD